MIKIFNYKDYKLHLNIEEILLVKEFEKVMEWDTTEDKAKAFEVFKYLYLVCDFRSPYREESDQNKKELAKQDTDISNRVLDSKMVENAEKKYKQILRSNRIIRMIDDMYIAVDELSNYFRTINFEDKVEHGASKGKLLHSPTELMRVIEKADKLLETLQSLRKRVEEELSEEKDIRGGAEAGFIR